MTSPHIAIAAAVGTTAGAALLALFHAGLPALSAPRDFLDDPVSVAVDTRGDVVVGLRTDVASGVVRRFSAAGEQRSATAWSGALGWWPYVAEGPDGTVFVAQSESDEVAVVDAAGQVGPRWTVAFPDLPFGPHGLIATDALARPATTTLVALVQAPGQRQVTRFTLEGRELGRWSVDQRAYDLAVVRAPDGLPRVLVVGPGPFGGSARIAAYRLDGTVEDDAHVDVDGDVLGIDTSSGRRVRLIVRPELSPTAHLDGRGGPVVEGDPRDLAVAPNGDLFVVVSRQAENEPGIVRHYTTDGCLVATWPSELLNGHAGAAPTPGSAPCPGRGATPTAVGPPTTDPPSSATTSPTPTPDTPPAATTTAPPPATRTPVVIVDGMPAYLPLARRDHSAGR